MERASQTPLLAVAHASRVAESDLQSWSKGLLSTTPHSTIECTLPFGSPPCAPVVDADAHSSERSMPEDSRTSYICVHFKRWP